MKKWIIAILAIFAAIVLIYLRRKPEAFKPEFSLNDYVTLHNFFMGHMIDPQGGVYTNYQAEEIAADAEITKGHYVLSESQGLLMEYALLIDDQALFGRTWQFVQDYMVNSDGSFAWRVSPEYTKTGESTSTIDDLQIILQLLRAQVRWPELSEELSPAIMAFVEAFPQYTYGGLLINGYDGTSKAKMLELDSCYIHLNALSELKRYSREPLVNDTYQSGRQLLDGMYISRKFPFTHKRFLVESQMIERRGEINMIEALLVQLHLAQAGERNEAVIEWLKQHIDQGIMGYYSPEGEAVGRLESSAVYGLIAQIAYYGRDGELYNKALKKGTSLLMDAVTKPEQQDILSYDNLQILIAYGLGKENGSFSGAALPSKGGLK